MNDPIKRLERLGEKGVIVSIVYGQCGNLGLSYSVDVLNSNGENFDMPFCVETFEGAIEVAEEEIRKRGWALAEQ